MKTPINNLINKLKGFLENSKKNRIKAADKSSKGRSKKPKDTYFTRAKSWADDIYAATVVSRNRYKAAFYGALGLCVVLVLCVLMLVPAQHTELVVVHEGNGGYVWLSTTKRNYHPAMNWVREQAELAHYVIARESYDPTLYRYQTKEVNLLSSPEIQAEYELAQDEDNKSSPINVLGAKGYRTVVVNSILPLDSESQNKEGQSKADRHVNLAQINFVIEDHLFGQKATIKLPYTALVSWKYTGVPSKPDAMLKDWDGFKVTKYLVQPKNIDKSDSE